MWKVLWLASKTFTMWWKCGDAFATFELGMEEEMSKVNFIS